MKYSLLICFVSFCVFSCKLPDTDKKYTDPESVTYIFRLNPKAGSSYYYDITSSTDVQVEFDKNEVENMNKAWRPFHKIYGNV